MEYSFFSATLEDVCMS